MTSSEASLAKGRDPKARPQGEGSLFTEEDVRVLLSEVTKRAPQGVREVKKVLSCAFTYGKAHIPGVKANPCMGVPVTVSKGKRDRWLTDEELMTFFETLPKMDDEVSDV